WKYRANNRKARYMPDWDGNRALELSWWAIPGVIILVLSIITWHSAHALDPFRPIESKVPPINIQVVSLDWKWLFIYPQQGIASLNFLQIPTNAPINFELTSDSVMNSFWLPALGGQIYTMPGMNTQLHLMATEAGSYRGSSANLSGRGFAGMDFTAQAGSEAQFEQWVKQAQRSAVSLSMPAYNQLAKPSRNNPPAQYSNVQPDLYNAIVAKYMGPVLAPDSADVASGMSHG
ncbi:MAG TPA: COX aromatic rich motif-containing protein, partial [Candidatus Saccharimonadales bacterium]|nr:COX aromatic rich motif-containing protein [Candidatus Saccharimonadales bacterium]